MQLVLREEGSRLDSPEAVASRFESIGAARAWMDAFTTWYNHDPRLSGIGLHTPASVHYGTAEQISENRQRTRCQSSRS